MKGGKYDEKLVFDALFYFLPYIDVIYRILEFIQGIGCGNKSSKYTTLSHLEELHICFGGPHTADAAAAPRPHA